MKSALSPVVSFFICLFAANTASGTDYPYSGYFSGGPEKRQPGFMQAKCALKFYRQEKDGKAKTYFYDKALYESTGQLRYRLASETECFHNPVDRTEVCSDKTYTNGEASITSFYIFLVSVDPDQVHYVTFFDATEMYTFVKSSDKSLPNAEFPTASNWYAHRCVGFGDAALAKFMSDEPNPLSQAESDKMLLEGVSEKDIPAALDIMDKIGVNAHNATLPGQ